MVAPVTRWSTLRTHLSDWRSGIQNFSRSLVSPLDQAREVINHPLPMEDFGAPLGLQMLGIDTSMEMNHLPIVNYDPAIAPNPVPFVPVMQSWLEVA